MSGSTRDGTGRSGVLVAGGASERMGRDKLRVPFGGEPLAARAVRALTAVADDVVVASGDGERLGWLGLPQVADAVPGQGPLGGLVAGLEAARFDAVAVVAGDMPFASAPVLRILFGLLEGHDAVVPRTERGPEPLHAVYAKAAAPSLHAELEGGRLALHRALGALRIRWVDRDRWDAADPSGRFAVNANRPEDLARFGTL